MKAVVLLGDGMADDPLPELGGLTPLEYAGTPNMDRVALEGRTGLVATVPDGFEAGSDVANLGLLGYDPARYYTGRGPLEAASMGVALGDDDVAYRCNLVTVLDGVMADFSAGHITSAEGAALLGALQPALPTVRVVPGISYRNLLVVPGGAGGRGTPPHDIVGEPVEPHLPNGPDRDLLLACMAAAEEVFPGHPVNRERIAAGKPPATGIWPWSGGRRPALPRFADIFGCDGGMISAVDLLNGIAQYAGLEVIRVPGATGYLDTDFEGEGPGRPRCARPARLRLLPRRGARRGRAHGLDRGEGQGNRARGRDARDDPGRVRRRGRGPPGPRDPGAYQDAHSRTGPGRGPRTRYGRHAPLLGEVGGEGESRAARRDIVAAAPARPVLSRHQPPCIITGQWG